MTLASALDDFCVPAAGSDTLRQVMSAALRRGLRQLPEVLRAHARGPHAADVVEFSRVVGPLARDNPGALATVLRRPEVSVWLRCLREDGPPSVDRAHALASLLGTLALALAQLDALPQPITLRSVGTRLLSARGRLALTIPSDTNALTFRSGEVVAERSTGTLSLPLVPDDNAYARIEGTAARLALVDDNPLAALEAHPDKDGNAVDLGGRPATQWCEALARALATIERFLPPFRAEVELLLHQVVPVGWDEERHLSASIQESIGTIYLSLHPRPLTMVEAIIHEVSHNKLAALFESDPLLTNAFEAMHASPVRPDPRPLHGVLLAVHAFLPVAALYAAMAEQGQSTPDMQRRFVEIVQGNHEAAEVLRAHGKPTERGRSVLAEIDRLDRRFVAMIRQSRG